jgi:SNF family Na+-dependent transporter
VMFPESECSMPDAVPKCFDAGIGYTMIGMNLLVAIYYNVILALSVFYLAASLTSTLPWADCGHWWNQHCSKNAYHGMHASFALC